MISKGGSPGEPSAAARKEAAITDAKAEHSVSSTGPDARRPALTKYGEILVEREPSRVAQVWEGTLPAGFERKGTELERARLHGVLDELSLVFFQGRHDELCGCR